MARGATASSKSKGVEGNRKRGKENVSFVSESCNEDLTRSDTTLDTLKENVCNNIFPYKSIWRSNSKGNKAALDWVVVAAKSSLSVPECKKLYDAVKKSFQNKIRKALLVTPAPKTWNDVRIIVENSKNFKVKYQLGLWRKLKWLAKQLTEQALAKPSKSIGCVQLADADSKNTSDFDKEDEEAPSVQEESAPAKTSRKRKGAARKSSMPPHKKSAIMIPTPFEEDSQVISFDVVKGEVEDDSEYLSRGPPIVERMEMEQPLPGRTNGVAAGKDQELTQGGNNELQKQIAEAEEYGQRNALFQLLQHEIIKQLWHLPLNVFNRFLDGAKAHLEH